MFMDYSLANDDGEGYAGRFPDQTPADGCPYQKLHPPQFQVAPLQRLLVRVRESHDSSRQAEIRGLLRRTRSVFWILYSNYFGIALPVIVREGIIAREVVI